MPSKKSEVKIDVPYIEDDSLITGEGLSLRWIPVAKIPDLLWEDNPKSHDLGKTWESVVKNGFADPAKWDNNLMNRAGGQGALVFGNGRCEAVWWGWGAYQRGEWKGDIPRGIGTDEQGNWYIQCKFGLDAISEAAAAAFAIDHNVLTLSGGDYDIAGMLAMFDEKGLAKVWKGVSEQGESLLTLDGDDLDALLGFLDGDAPQETPEAQIDRAEELNKKWLCKTGDLWLIPSKSGKGTHKLLCGDSTKAEDVGRLMGEEKPLLMVSDPPYGVEYDSAWRAEYSSGEYSVGTIENDNISDWSEAWRLFDAQIMYIWHGGLHAHVVAHSLIDNGYDLRAQIIWNKSVMVFGRGAYHWKHEPCWYAVKKGENANWQGDRSQHTVWDYGNGSGAGRTGDEADDFHAGHISQKPVELMRRPIENHTKRGAMICDPFGGSGSTMIAAEQLGRYCHMMELDPKFCAVILERLSDMGLFPVLES